MHTQTVTTTRMSSKGQVVIPEEVRNRMKLDAGTEFVVVAERDFVVFKRLSPPAMEEFETLLADARANAKRAGMKPSAIAKAIAKARGRR